MGGMQIQVIPSFPDLPQSWASYSVITTPRELGLTPGGGGCIFPNEIVHRVERLSRPIPTLGCESWPIYIMSLTGRRFEVIVDIDTTVSELRCIVYGKEGIVETTERSIQNPYICTYILYIEYLGMGRGKLRVITFADLGYATPQNRPAGWLID